MKVTAYLYETPPHRYLGADLMMGRLLGALADRGHEVVIMTHVDHGFYVWNGIPVVPRHRTLPHPVDVFVSIPELGRMAASFMPRAPYVAVCHNTGRNTMTGLERLRPQLVVANSHQMARELARFAPLVVHPPIDEDRIRPDIEDRTCITLVNLSPDKGVGVFYDMARRMPEKPFLGVVGGHGRQIRVRLPNVTTMAQTGSMGLVYARTKVLLFPSVSESYGMVAAEATTLGIPVLATRLPGIEEALGNAGWWIDPRTSDDTEQILRSLMEDDVVYANAVQQAKERGVELHQRSEESLARWVQVVESLPASLV